MMEPLESLINKRFSILGGKTAEEFGFNISYAKEKVQHATSLWQELALEICDHFKLKPKDRGIIFKVCKNYNLDYVRHCFNETKELATGKNPHRYFIKIIHK